MLRRSLLAAGAAVSIARPARANEPVDVLLVLAVDVSRSIDEDEARLQREGYRTAVSDAVVVRAIQGGMIGAVGLCYIEWAGIEYQRIVIPWTRIGGQRDADQWAATLAEAPRASLSWTSISGALRAGRAALAEAPFEGTRRVIDVSGDGVNNSGPPAEMERDRLVAEGVTINGLPIVNDRVYPPQDPTPEDDYRFPLQLLAQAISFDDPFTKQRRQFSSKRRLELP
jgi:hypothetical protein